MQQLSGLDNLFLATADNRQHMHIACLGIYDPSTAEGGKVRFKHVLDFFRNKVHEVPFFRRRLAEVPFGLDRPFWIDEKGVDVEYHVRHIALPAPGDWRQLMIQIARLHARPLDLSKPLWEVYVIGGLDKIKGIKKGSFALYLKMHHAAVDGQAAVKLIQILHTTTPEYDTHSKVSSVMVDRDPGSMEILLRSAMHRGAQLGKGINLSIEIAKTSLRLSSKYSSDAVQQIRSAFDKKLHAKGLSSVYKKKQANRFDGKISPHRSVDAMGLSLEDCATIRQHVAGATINDIFMSTCGGALRRYLDAHDELPEDTINSMMPMAAGGDKSGNSVSMAVVPVHTEIEDPIERLYEIKQSTKKSKQLQDEIGRDLLPNLMDILPVPAAKKIVEAAQGQTSLVVSNVRGPAVPLYLAGARCQMFFPVSIPYDGLGLNVTGFSYLDTLWVCVTACREMLPDPEFFSQCMRDSFDQLLQAAKSTAKNKTR